MTAQVLLVSTAVPTAVNTVLLATEFGNEPEYAASAVFLSTLLSAVTVTCVIYLSRLMGVGRLLAPALRVGKP